VSVLPECQGRGAARAILDQLLSRARRSGASHAVLNVAVDNPRAQRIYEQLGFVVRGEELAALSNEHAHVPGHRQMALALGPDEI
jgi:ribosomal protein S18 acetylase RimI-like enzyme